MVTKCAVLGCKSEWSPRTGVSFHQVTKNEKLLALWLSVVNIRSFKQSKICSLHFRSKDLVDHKDGKRLKRDAVPVYNNTDEVVETDDDSCDEDEEDNRNLLMLKNRLTSSSNHESSSTQIQDDTESDDEHVQKFEMVIPSCNCNSVKSNKEKKMNSVGTQVNKPTDGEASLRQRIKVMGMRLKRREEKVYYLKTVLNMIKKTFKGTDMEYKLSCELENISKFSESIKSRGKNKRPITTESLVDDCVIDDEESSGDENGTFYEVALSPNLKPQNRVQIVNEMQK
ncbi:uncharacterized protein [Choristoneura fumiferana]|uniref:uncharacterized protein n=1 Tax=Choristoneura fumiferana TaxID=7141 RepID=UPI003D158942